MVPQLDGGNKVNVIYVEGETFQAAAKEEEGFCCLDIRWKGQQNTGETRAVTSECATVTPKPCILKSLI